MAKIIPLIIGAAFMFKGSENLYGTGKPFGPTVTSIDIATPDDVNSKPFYDTAELMRVGLLARFRVNGKNSNGKRKSIRVFCQDDSASINAFKTAVENGITIAGFTFKTCTSDGRRQVLK